MTRDDINVSRALSFSSQPWSFRCLFEGATREQVSTGLAWIWWCASWVVHLTITEARVKKLRDLADEALLRNVVSRKWLKSFAGKGVDSRLLETLPPFDLGCHLRRPHGTCLNCVWVKQCVVAVKWVQFRKICQNFCS